MLTALRSFYHNASVKKSYVPSGTLRFFALRLVAKILVNQSSFLLENSIILWAGFGLPFFVGKIIVV